MSQSNLTSFFEKLGPISARTSPEKKASVDPLVALMNKDVVEKAPVEEISSSQEPPAKKKRKRKRNRKKAKQPQESSGSLVITVDDSSRSSMDSNLLPEKTSPKGTAKTEQKDLTNPPKTGPEIIVQKELTGAEKEKDEHQPKAKRTGSTTKDPSEKQWVIEAILQHRYVDTTKIEYFIKWKDWPSSTNTWEPLEHMVNCQKMIDDYHENHRQECLEHNKHFPSRLNETGFGRGLKPEEILGFCDDFGEFAMLIKWKSSGSNTFTDIVSADEVYEKAPAFMCAFIESVITGQLMPKDEDNEESEEEENDDQLDSNDNKDENGESESRFGDACKVDVLKDPMILGNVVINRKNYFTMKERKGTDESQYLIPTKTAYKYFRKAVFRYFERNLVRSGL